MQDNSRITPRDEDFAQWYQDVVAAGELAEHSGIKGAMIIKPHGYAIWELMQATLDQRIKATGHKNAYFPLLIPESYLTREKEHVEGFSPELAVVTHAGGEKLEEPLVVRPTSETIIYATFAKWVQSWRDLPLLINQWANVVRWELRPRLFLRTTEFLWQEGHTAHATEDEAEAEARRMLDEYQDFAVNYLAVPVIPGQKTEAEKFAGALRTYTIEAMMQDGKALQFGTSHNLGQNFAKVFEVMYTTQEGKREYAWNTSWGVSTRMIGGLIMAHSDDTGLVLPPKVAPIQVVIVPIAKDEAAMAKVMSAVEGLATELQKHEIRVEIDTRDFVTPGFKFNEWEKKGVPIRLELGLRDLEQDQVTMAIRDTKEKSTVSLNQGDAAQIIRDALDAMQARLLDRATAFRDEHTFHIDDYQAFKEQIERGGFIWSHWCGNAECEKQINEETKATIRCISFDQDHSEGSCIKCGQASQQQVIFARAY